MFGGRDRAAVRKPPDHHEARQTFFTNVATGVIPWIFVGTLSVCLEQNSKQIIPYTNWVQQPSQSDVNTTSKSQRVQKPSGFILFQLTLTLVHPLSSEHSRYVRLGKVE